MSEESKKLRDEFLQLKPYDVVDVTLDFTPDGIDNPETKRGMFFKFAENVPAGWIPFGYVKMLERDGWFPYYAVKKVKFGPEKETPIEFSEIFEESLWQIDPSGKYSILWQVLGWIKAAEKYDDFARKFLKGAPAL